MTRKEALLTQSNGRKENLHLQSTKPDKSLPFLSALKLGYESVKSGKVKKKTRKSRYGQGRGCGWTLRGVVSLPDTNSPPDQQLRKATNQTVNSEASNWSAKFEWGSPSYRLPNFVEEIDGKLGLGGSRARSNYVIFLLSAATKV